MDDALIAMIAMFPLASWLSRSCDEIAPANQVGRRGAERKNPVDESAAAVPELAERTDGFHPAEGLLNQFPPALAEGVARVAHRAPVNGTAAESSHMLRDVWRDAHPADGGAPVADLVQFVRADGDLPGRQGQLAEHHDAGAARGHTPR